MRLGGGGGGGGSPGRATDAVSAAGRAGAPRAPSPAPRPRGAPGPPRPSSRGPPGAVGAGVGWGPWPVPGRGARPVDAHTPPGRAAPGPLRGPAWGSRAPGRRRRRARCARKPRWVALGLYPRAAFPSSSGWASTPHRPRALPKGGGHPTSRAPRVLCSSPGTDPGQRRLDPGRPERKQSGRPLWVGTLPLQPRFLFNGVFTQNPVQSTPRSWPWGARSQLRGVHLCLLPRAAGSGYSVPPVPQFTHL